MRRRNFIINTLLKHFVNTLIYKYTDFEEDERSNACTVKSSEKMF